MSTKLLVLLLGAAGSAGLVIGYLVRLLVTLGKRTSIERRMQTLVLEAEERGKKIILAAEQKALTRLEEVKEETREREEKLKRTEERLIKKEELLDNRQVDIDHEVEHIKTKVVEIKEIRERAEALEAERRKSLEHTSNLSTTEAKEELLKVIERQYEEDILVRIQKLEMTAEEKIERRAKELLTTAIHRLGNSVAADTMSTSVPIPSEDLKGKIIGKEGRNIKAFERAAGVELIVDDTPGSILISCFDPVRRQVARVALEALITDGRIQPAKIEEAIEKDKADINKVIKEKGEQAVY